MTNVSQGVLNFGKFPINGIFIVLLFMIFLGLSLFPVTAQDLLPSNCENQTTQISIPDSQKIPVNDPDHYLEQPEEKEEEKQEEKLVDFFLDSIESSFVCEWFINFTITKAYIGSKCCSYSQIPYYILFRSLKLDMV